MNVGDNVISSQGHFNGDHGEIIGILPIGESPYPEEVSYRIVFPDVGVPIICRKAEIEKIHEPYEEEEYLEDEPLEIPKYHMLKPRTPQLKPRKRSSRAKFRIRDAPSNTDLAEALMKEYGKQKSVTGTKWWH